VVLEKFPLEYREEILGLAIVTAVPLPAHAGGVPMDDQRGEKFVIRKGALRVRAMSFSLDGRPQRGGPGERRHEQSGVVPGVRRPDDYEAPD
jgi:hypothetical protein